MIQVSFAVSSDFKNELETIKTVVRRMPMSKKTVNVALDNIFGCQSPKCFSLLNQLISFLGICLRLTSHFLQNVLKMSMTCSIIIVMTYLLITNHNASQKFITRNSQSYIYPIMRTVRLWTLPIIRKHHSLTEWHEEDCLLKNPFYQESLLDCWPCEDVRTMVDLTSLYNYSKAYVYNEQPFLARDVMQKKIILSDLVKLYKEHNIKLERGTARYTSTHPTLQSLSDFFKGASTLTSVKDFHILWKVNRVAAARVLRQAFKRPYFVPNDSEVALQRYLCISGSEAPQFFLPATDFANVWLAQGQGYRLIVLDPSEPCQNNCSTLSVLLRPKDVLYYNWQFWKPRSLPARLSEDISITYIGSFY